MNKSLLCRNYQKEKLQHVLVPHSKWFGLVKGERCVLCNKFFIDESLKFWKINDN